MVQKKELFVEVMASANRSSFSLGKRKSRDVEVEAEATEPLDSLGNVTEIPRGLAPITVESMFRSETQKNFEDEDEERCVTPKSEEHKIASMRVCPPAPRKPKSTPVKRNSAIISCRRALHFPSDSPDLDILFGSDLLKDHQHQRKKLRNRE